MSKCEEGSFKGRRTFEEREIMKVCLLNTANIIAYGSENTSMKNSFKTHFSSVDITNA